MRTDLNVSNWCNLNYDMIAKHTFPLWLNSFRMCVVNDRLINTIFCLMLAGLLIFVSTNVPIDYDEAFNASVAKSLATGYGYSTPYPVRTVFDPYITTGPGLLLPIAVAVFLKPNTYYAPGLMAGIVNAGLLWFLGDLLLKRNFAAASTSSPWLRGLIVMPITLVVLLFGLAGYTTVGLGECASTLSLAIGCVLVADLVTAPKIERKDAFVAGLALGFSLLFKFIAILPVTVILAGAAAWGLARRGSDAKLWLINLGCGAASPSFLFLLVRLPYLDIKLEAVRFARSGSGINLFKNGLVSALAAIRDIAIANSHTLLHWIGGFIGMVFCTVAATAILWPYGRSLKQGDDRNKFFLLLLLAGGFSIVVWWVVMSPWGLIRHVYVGMVMILIALSLSPFLLRSTPRLVGALSLVLLVVLWGNTWHARLDGVPPGFANNFTPQRGFDISPAVANYTMPRLSPDPRIANQRDALSKIEELRTRYPAYHFLGCGLGANRDLEFLSKEASLFRDCLDESRGTKSFLVMNGIFLVG